MNPDVKPVVESRKRMAAEAAKPAFESSSARVVPPPQRATKKLTVPTTTTPAPPPVPAVTAVQSAPTPVQAAEQTLLTPALPAQVTLQQAIANLKLVKIEGNSNFWDEWFAKKEAINKMRMDVAQGRMHRDDWLMAEGVLLRWALTNVPDAEKSIISSVLESRPTFKAWYDENSAKVVSAGSSASSLSSGQGNTATTTDPSSLSSAAAAAVPQLDGTGIEEEDADFVVTFDDDEQSS